MLFWLLKTSYRENMKLRKNKILGMLIIIVVALFLFQLDVNDIFSHGYVTDSVVYDQIYENDIQGYVDLSISDYVIEFTPIKKHFAGFILYFVNQPDRNKGIIKLTVKDDYGNIIDIIDVDLSNVHDKDDYKVYANKTLKKGENYTLTISAVECATIPNMILIDKDYITEECKDNNLLIGYAYEESTFSITEKTLITLFIVALCLIILGVINNKEKCFGFLYNLGIFLILMTIMAWNYSFNTFGYKNTNFTNFDKQSECLVTTTIKADKEGMTDLIVASGLNRYTDVTGNWKEYDKTFLTDANWTKGYNNSKSQILLRTSDFVTNMAIVGNSILFENGEQYPISEVSTDSHWTKVTIDAGRILNWWKFGDLSNIRFLDSNGNLMIKGYVSHYVSQYGLQGKVFKHLARVFDVEFLNVLTALLTAITLLTIVYLVYYKYNAIFAGVFYFTFLLGSWIVNFADNLYWVEFTWFLPMVVGLFCAWKVEKKGCRIIAFIGTYIFITLKSLCGYEYISVIMMGMITFLLVDLIETIVEKNKNRAKLIFRTIIVIGIVALVGFFTAICIHAPQKPGANGNIITGMKLIFQNDVIRRTSGGNINKFDTLTGVEGYAQLASIWETVVKYFHFKTEVITGVDGSLFPIICITPLLLFINDARKQKLNVELIAMYFVSFLTSISWFILAKSHSYVHTHLNYVLWYFGYVQVCLYVIVNKIITKNSN